MTKKATIISGAIMLTFSGVLSRILGFLYRIFLSNLIGAHGLGIFQMIFPVLTFFVSFCCGGIQTAVSRFVAESRNIKQSFSVLIASLVMSEFLAFIALFLMYGMSDFLATSFIGDKNCSDLLKYASYAIPLSAFHSCVIGFYLGLKKPFVPSFVQIVEQVSKLAVLFLLSLAITSEGGTITPKIAVFSLVISEGFGALFCLFAITNTGNKIVSKNIFSELFVNVKKLFRVSYILTINKILLTFFQSAEAILVPFMLIKYGLSSKDALSLYGILAGITLPVITFPSAISHSVASMIMPAIADANIAGNKHKIKLTTEFTIWFSLVTGIFCIGIFIFYGDFIGGEVFGHLEAGKYIKTLSWLCPLLYMSISFGSILHGLGKTTAAFVHNVAAILTRLGFLYFLVPLYGIRAYFWGLLISELLTVFLHLYYINKEIPINFSPVTNIIKPALWLMVSLSAGHLCSYIFSSLFTSQKLIAHYCMELTCALLISGIFFSFAYKQWLDFKRLLN